MAPPKKPSKFVKKDSGFEFDFETEAAQAAKEAEERKAAKKAEKSQPPAVFSIEELRKNLNRGSDVAIAFNVLEGAPCDARFKLSSGSKMLNFAMTGERDVAFPSGRIVMLIGKESTGKSLVGYLALADCQRQGGVAVLLDPENAANLSWMAGIGVDLENLVYVKPRNVEQVFDIVDKIVSSIRVTNKNIPVCVLWDSVAMTPTEMEQNADYDDLSLPGIKARAITQCGTKFQNTLSDDQLCFIVINHIKSKIGVVFGNPDSLPGGAFLPYAASIIVEFKKPNLLADKEGIARGMVLRPKIRKTRYRANSDEVEIPIIYNQGVQDEDSWIPTLSKYKIIAKEDKGWFTVDPNVLVTDDGELIRFQKSSFKKVLKDNPTLEATLFDALSKKVHTPLMLPGEELVELELDSFAASAD